MDVRSDAGTHDLMRGHTILRMSMGGMRGKSAKVGKDGQFQVGSGIQKRRFNLKKIK